MYTIRAKGFTLLELLIVIAIIGILASMVLVATGAGRQQSQNAKVYQQLREIETAFLLYAADRLTVWPDVVTGAFNYSRVDEFNLDHLVTGLPSSWEGPRQFPGFGLYLRSVPPDPYSSGGFYGYSNFNVPLSSGCSATANQGVAIRIAGGTGPEVSSLFNYLDDQIDNGDGATCGRVRLQSGEIILYAIATDPNDILGAD